MVNRAGEFAGGWLGSKGRACVLMLRRRVGKTRKEIPSMAGARRREAPREGDGWGCQHDSVGSPQRGLQQRVTEQLGAAGGDAKGLRKGGEKEAMEAMGCRERARVGGCEGAATGEVTIISTLLRGS